MKHLIQSACEILQNEQLQMQKGTKEDGQLLIQQLRWYASDVYMDQNQHKHHETI